MSLKCICIKYTIYMISHITIIKMSFFQISIDFRFCYAVVSKIKLFNTISHLNIYLSN